MSLGEVAWTKLVDQLSTGDCTPFIGAGACLPTLPAAGKLSKVWAKRHVYPFKDPENLSRVMQYAVVSADDRLYVKETLARELKKMTYTHPSDPHALLATFPISVYFTTNYDNFMEEALDAEGKNPKPKICPWWYEKAPKGLKSDIYRIDKETSRDEPIVYHLHGSWDVPDSLVVTEDDYIRFLVNGSLGRGAGSQWFVPAEIKPNLQRSILFIGYSLQDVTFRVIFRQLLREIPPDDRRGHVSVQVSPSDLIDNHPGTKRRAEDYVAKYLKNDKVTVYWVTAGEFCAELRRRL